MQFEYNYWPNGLKIYPISKKNKSTQGSLYKMTKGKAAGEDGILSKTGLRICITNIRHLMQVPTYVRYTPRLA